MEDKLNVAYDTGVAGVQVILLIEDNIRYYSSFLPVIYTEIINHSQSLISRGHQRGPQDPAHAGPAQDPALHHLRRGLAVLRRPTRRTFWESSPTSSSRKPARWNPQAGAEFARRVQAGLARHPRAAAIEPSRKRRPRPGGRGGFPAQGLPHPPRRPTPLHDRQLRLRRLRLPAAGRHTAWAGQET